MTEPGIGVCGIDVGGSGCRVAVARADAPPPAPELGRGLTIRAGGIDLPDLLGTLRPLVERACKRSDVGHLDALVLGAASVATLLDDPGALHSALHEHFGARVTVIAADILTSHIGALGGVPGVVIAAGTGAVALGTDHVGLWRRIDGWGHLIGDAGSGSWIGTRAVDAAFRALDQRPGGSAELLEMIRNLHGSPEQFVRTLYGRADRPAQLASLVPPVAALADAGHTASRMILQAAGRELAQTTSAALGSDLATVARTGGVFNCSAILRDTHAEELARLAPDAVLVPLAGSSLDGALALARTAAQPRPSALDRPPYLSTVHHR